MENPFISPLQNKEKTIPCKNVSEYSGTIQTIDVNASYPIPEVTPFELAETFPETLKPSCLTNNSITMHSFNLPQGLEASLSLWLNGREIDKQSETGKLSHLINQLFK